MPTISTKKRSYRFNLLLIIKLMPLTFLDRLNFSKLMGQTIKKIIYLDRSNSIIFKLI